MAAPTIVVHYHELWLKGRNRRFFLARMSHALRSTLEDLGLERIERPGDRVLLHFRESGACRGSGGTTREVPDDAPDATMAEAVARVGRVLGIANFALARSIDHDALGSDMDELGRVAWEEMAPLKFDSFAVRAKRSDKSFPRDSMEIEKFVGGYVMDRLREAGRNVRVRLNDPDITCYIEITPGPALVYARRFPGPGGLPANSGGRVMCLLSGGFDSAVAAYRMMLRGAHASFVHFYGGGAQPGESSVHVARELARRLVPYQLSANVYLVPLEPIQREIVHRAPEIYRVLLYRRMMMRIAQRLARRDHALALVTGDSLGQVASQTLQNMVAVGAAVRMPVFRPLAGMDKQEIIQMARKIGTYDVSAEPFHDCCPIFMPRRPALYAKTRDLDGAEADLDVVGLTRAGAASAALVRLRYANGRVEETESAETIGARKEPVQSENDTAKVL
jgi:thiamine biosynthesis protein ThiI